MPQSKSRPMPQSAHGSRHMAGSGATARPSPTSQSQLIMPRHCHICRHIFSRARTATYSAALRPSNFHPLLRTPQKSPSPTTIICFNCGACPDTSARKYRNYTASRVHRRSAAAALFKGRRKPVSRYLNILFVRAPHCLLFVAPDDASGGEAPTKSDPQPKVYRRPRNIRLHASRSSTGYIGGTAVGGVA